MIIYVVPFKKHIQLQFLVIFTQLPIKTKLVICPIMLYACPIWKSAGKCNLKKMQIVHNKYLKIIFNLPKRYGKKQII